MSWPAASLIASEVRAVLRGHSRYADVGENTFKPLQRLVLRQGQKAAHRQRQSMVQRKLLRLVADFYMRRAMHRAVIETF